MVSTPSRPPPAAVRLLKVKPEERLTIEGVLAHPWLNCTEALDNVLPSAQMMMDKVKGRSQPADAEEGGSCAALLTARWRWCRFRLWSLVSSRLTPSSWPT